MENSLNNFETSLFIWQFLIFALLILVIYFAVKLYKKIIKYLESKSKVNE